jgi:DNA mismatch repair protein MutS2
MICPDKTRSDLEWDRLLAAVAERCVSPTGHDEARSLELPESHAESRTRLAEAREATLLHQDGEPLPVAAFPVVREALERLRVGGVLAGPELRGVAQTLLSARALRRFLVARRARASALFQSCSTDPSLDAVGEEVASCFDADGTLADHASPRLRELRGEAHATRQRILSRLDDLMRRYERVLQDRFVTEREGRYVLPVRSDAHDRFPGIVHSASASGATIFVEPRAIIPIGNRLKMLEGDVTREEHAVFARLSARIADVLPSVVACADALARADVRAATARLAVEKGLHFPEIAPEPRVSLRAARHPLLLLELEHVVPSDLSVATGHAVVVSGPNAGGKTVALKTLGLAVLSVRAGLPVSCAEGSEVGLFDVVLTDVGDDQSLHKNLSTFSAHVRNLAHILDETRPGALVLLDEIATGTDPREGEALAAGVLDSLCRRGGAVVATTHYEGLKALALADPRFVNASVGFDLATMEPTFELALGVPGRSSALAVAKRFGLPPTVIERAERFLSREHRSFEDEVRRLSDERAALELARAGLEAEREQARETRVRLEGELELARDRERRTVSKETAQILEGVRRAREELRAAQARLRSKKPTEAELREAGRAVDRVAKAVAIGGELEPAPRVEAPRAPIDSTRLKKGEKVWVSRLRATAEVVEVLAEGVRVAAGPLKLLVPTAELLSSVEAAPATPKEPARPTGRAPGGRRDEPLEVAVQTRESTCDLRGLRVDDALAMATAFLDRALTEGLRVAFLIHGHGTGALRDAVRRELAASPYVRAQRPGDEREGGDGVTVVWLA